MYDSRTIAKFFKKNKQNGQIISLEFLDRLTPNIFELTKNGKLESTTFGSFSSIIVKLTVFKEGQFNSIEYGIHPDRLSLLAEKILNEKYSIVKTKSDKLGLNGFVNTSIFTSKPIDEMYESSFLNIFLDNEERFVIRIETGKANLIKDEFNRNEIENFIKNKSISLYIPIDEMELLCLKIKEYICTFRNTIMPLMLDGRNLYEKRCKTIFKDVKGDPIKVKQIEEKFFKLNAQEKIEVEEGRKKI